MHPCDKCLNIDCPLNADPCKACLEGYAVDKSRPRFAPQAFLFDDLGAEAKERVKRETRSNIADEEGTCKDTDEQLVAYIREAKHIYMKDGELLE